MTSLRLVSAPDFDTWLAERRGSNDWIGSFAEAALDDPDFPIGCTLEQRKAYFLADHGPGITIDPNAIRYLETAWAAWEGDAVALVKLGLDLGLMEGEQMASAYEATVQLYKNDDEFSIVTDAITVESFEQALAKVIAEDWTEYDAGLLVPQVRAILNKLQGYKAAVHERRLLIAGHSMPAAVDLRYSTGPGLPTVELSGEAVDVDAEALETTTVE